MKSILALLTFTAALAFADNKYTPGSDNRIFKKDVVSMQVPWIKDKGNKYDIHVLVHNESPDKGIIIFLGDMGCQRGEVSGILKHTFFNTGEKTIDFRPGQTKDFTLVCKAEAKNGDFKLKISKVYSNPSMDGKTVGKVLAENLNWAQSDRHE